MAAMDKVKPKKTRLPFIPPKRQVTRRTKYIQPTEDKIISTSDDSLRSGLRATSTRGRRARSRSYGKVKFPRTSGNNLQSSCNRQVTKQKCFDRDIYVADDDQKYHIGDSVYIQSDTISSTYFIGNILDFRTTRKEELLVEVQWFYRPSEVPASVLDSLLQDRIIQSQTHDDTFSSLLNDVFVRTRELFRCGSTNNGENVNLTPATLIRGKCAVLPLSDIPNLKEYTTCDDNFFCILGFDPITRRLSDFKGEIRVGPSHQASLPTFSPEDNYSILDKIEDLVWDPIHFEDSEFQMYLKASRSVALHAGWCLRGKLEDGLMAMQSDLLTQHSYDLLHRSGYCTRAALKSIVDSPNAYDILYEKTWCRDEIKNFHKGIKKFGKQFHKLRNEFLPHKAYEDVIRFYYYWKKSPGGLANRNMRKSRKSMHLKKTSEKISPYTCLSDLFIDVLSCDDSEPSYPSKDNEKVNHISINEPQLYICQHCYCTRSKSWHHGGSENTLLCCDCRIYFCKYGQMRLILNKCDPPLDILKNASNFELIRRINAGECAVQNKNEDEQVESSDISESSDYESNLSEVEKLDSDLPKHYHREIEQGNFSLTTSDASLQEISRIPRSSSLFLPNTSELHMNNCQQSSSVSQDNQEFFPFPSLQASSEFSLRDSQSFSHIDDTPKNLSSSNTSILQSLLQGSDEKPLKMRSQNKVIAHDQHGVITSCMCYDDNPEDLDSILHSDCSSPDSSTEYPLLLAREVKQGAARLDFIYRTNINDHIIERKINYNGEDFHYKSDSQLKQGAKIKDNLFKSNVTFEKSTPQTQFSHTSIIPTSDQLLQQPSISHLSSTIPHVLSTNQVGSVIGRTIGSNNQIHTNNLIYGKSTPSLDQISKDNALYRVNQVHRLQHVPNSVTSIAGGPFARQVIPPLSICSNPLSVNHLTPDNEFHENLMQPLLNKQDYSSQASLSINETNSQKNPALNCFSTSSNIPLILKNMSGAPNVVISTLPNHIDLEQHPKEIQKVFHSPNQDDQLQPQIPRSSQVDSVNISQFPSLSNNQLQTHSGYQIHSQEPSPSSISFCQINRAQPFSNVLVAPQPENRPLTSSGNLVDMIPCSIEQGKLAYQQYIDLLHGHYSQQLNALMLSQLQSSGQPIHTQIPSSTLPLQLSQITHLPSHAIPPHNQLQDIPQVSTLPFSGIFPYNSEIVSQYSAFSFSTDRDNNPSLNISEKK